MPGRRHGAAIDTPTEADVGGDIASIDTRVPPSTMHDVNFADVVGKEPVVLVFATPQLCQPGVRTGGRRRRAGQGRAPIATRRSSTGDLHTTTSVARASGPRSLAWGLPTEPWVFTDRQDGKVAARLEGALSARASSGTRSMALRS